MNKFTKEMVDDYADKLLIGLTEEENKMVLDEFDIIDEQINIINDIPEIENYNSILEIHKGITDFCEKYRDIFKVDDYMYNISGYDAYLPFRMAIRDTTYFNNNFPDFVFVRDVGGDNIKLETIRDIIKK